MSVRSMKYLSMAARWLRNALIRLDPLFEGCESCPWRLTPAGERLRSALAPEFPVDAVYTWVDGCDPALAAKKAAHLPPAGAREEVCHGAGLHRNNDELRYALRSLEAYAPWVRRVFIVSDGQTPPWLDPAHPRLRLVDHRDYIPHEYLPTFNSHVIEAFLHRIPGLGEHYFYCNDDFFLARPLSKGFFFTANGLPRLFTDWRASRRRGYENPQSPHTHAYGNALGYMRARGLRPQPQIILAHAPYAQTLTLAREAFAFFAQGISAFAPNKFRSREDLAFAPQALPLYACARKRGVPCDVPHYYINTKRFDRRVHYEALLRQKGSDCQPPFFCLNDVGDRRVRNWREEMTAFLQDFFPTASSFERKG